MPEVEKFLWNINKDVEMIKKNEYYVFIYAC